MSTYKSSGGSSPRLMKKLSESWVLSRTCLLGTGTAKWSAQPANYFLLVQLVQYSLVLHAVGRFLDVHRRQNV